MGTRVSLTFYIEDEALANDAAEAVFDRLASIEEIISDWRSDSEIMRVQKGAVGHPTPISMDLARLLELSLMVARQSDGAFDVSCGATTKLWRQARQSGVVPAEVDIQTAASTCDYRQIILGHDETGPTLQIDQVGLELDFGGIGKGFGADEAMAVLAARGITSALVDFGGDMSVGQPPPGSKGWRIQLPDSDVLSLSSCGIATSGATEQFMMIDGQRRSHLVNPETGQAMIDGGEVTIVAPTAALADAWASVVLVAGLKRARALVDPDSGIQFLVPSRE